ncbi:hypothetical protein MKEN_00804800 [Mycena kentingensis (nom. inval.)]|nr:hypothetical protein MKEN_00804800 [Mycena kentingensis (nom. inval.)]
MLGSQAKFELMILLGDDLGPKARWDARDLLKCFKQFAAKWPMRHEREAGATPTIIDLVVGLQQNAGQLLLVYNLGLFMEWTRGVGFDSPQVKAAMAEVAWPFKDFGLDEEAISLWKDEDFLTACHSFYGGVRARLMDILTLDSAHYGALREAVEESNSYLDWSHCRAQMLPVATTKKLEKLELLEKVEAYLSQNLRGLLETELLCRAIRGVSLPGVDVSQGPCDPTPALLLGGRIAEELAVTSKNGKIVSKARQ